MDNKPQGARRNDAEEEMLAGQELKMPCNLHSSVTLSILSVCLLWHEDTVRYGELTSRN